MTTPYHKTTYPGDYGIYNIRKPILGHHYYILSLFDVHLGVTKNIYKVIMHFHLMTYGHALS